MHITIDEITGDGTVVRFTHDGGAADGIWLGAEPPRLGPVVVDLTVPGRFWWQDDVRMVVPERSADGASNPNGSDGTTGSRPALPVTGRAVAVDAEAGVLTLQLGDALIRIETNGPVPAGVVGAIVEVDSPLLELTPTDR